MTIAPEELAGFLEKWQDDRNGCKKAFQRLRESLESMDSVVLDFVAREGVTYSLRAKHEMQQDKPLFAMVDVIEDSPRWLSVCFYAEMITDPEERGDYVPGGLLGEDGLCFDIDEYSDENVTYLQQRLQEACNSSTS